MRKIFLTIGNILLSTMFIQAQAINKVDEKPKPVAVAVASTLAEMTFEKDIHDFGTIDYAGNGTYEFKFKLDCRGLSGNGMKPLED